jgi:hypothetical protein
MMLLKAVVYILKKYVHIYIYINVYIYIYIYTYIYTQTNLHSSNKDQLDRSQSEIKHSYQRYRLMNMYTYISIYGH